MLNNNDQTCSCSAPEPLIYHISYRLFMSWIIGIWQATRALLNAIFYEVLRLHKQDTSSTMLKGLIISSVWRILHELILASWDPHCHQHVCKCFIFFQAELIAQESKHNINGESALAATLLLYHQTGCPQGFGELRKTLFSGTLSSLQLAPM